MLGLVGVRTSVLSSGRVALCVCLFLTKVTGLLHEGTIPVSATRLTMADIIITFGHGLRGLLPSISGTVGLLSLWENGLEGHLQDLHMNHTSTLM
eukprot:2105293-Amphidinium_carterae.1